MVLKRRSQPRCASFPQTTAATKKPAPLVLVPPAVDPPEPDASGKVTYEGDWDRSGTCYTGEATVSCSGLTPGSEYDVQFLVVFRQSSSDFGTIWEWYSYETHRVAADKKGRLTTQLPYGSTSSVYGLSSGSNVLDVCVRTDQGNFVLLGGYDPSWWPVSY